MADEDIILILVMLLYFFIGLYYYVPTAHVPHNYKDG